MLLLYCHVSGGWDGNSRYDTILVYNPDTEGWSPAGKMRAERSLHALTIVNIDEVQPYCQWSVIGERSEVKWWLWAICEMQQHHDIINNHFSQYLLFSRHCNWNKHTLLSINMNEIKMYKVNLTFKEHIGLCSIQRMHLEIWYLDIMHA